jgi:hypothetical protein
MSSRPFEDYLRDLRDIRSTGAVVKEVSYYPALSNLLNGAGKTLKPKVRCILQLANRGAGNPDGGLFTPDQLQKGTAEPLRGQPPSRGVIEIKGTSDDAWVTANGKQVSRYWGEYRQVLVTNYRDFVLVGQDPEGKPVKLETYRLAESEADFWRKGEHPRAFAEQHEKPLIEYLQRVMLHGAPLATPKDVAWFLASYARSAKARLEGHDLPAMAAVRRALEEALGLQFQGEKGERFFRSTLIQTLFYGVFSAWVLWSKEHPPTSKEHFHWHSAAYHLRVPMIRKLFHLVADPSQMEALQLSEVLDWTAAILNRVDPASFFAQFEEGQAVQYFYEPFLEAFDPELRKQLGVWYTPPEIVRYMVARVDTVLREELGLAHGLADENVYVLDPCCGTGSYLVEVLRCVATTLKAKGGDALLGSDLKEAAMKRVFGFEVLPAPFVVAHLQLGLLLQNLGVPLDSAGQERVGVYLTNALTGWEPLDPAKEKAFQARMTGFPELLQERDQASHVKRQVPILVILGNPPYNAFAGVSPAEEQGLVEPFKKGLVTEWGIKKFNLDELYIRFFRLAERCIAEQTGRGVVCFISNFSYLKNPSFVVMRERFLSEFETLWFDCMNGDSRETGKRTPEGKPDPSVFSTEYNREGIRLGTAIGLMVRRSGRSREATVRFRQFWGVKKRADLVDSLKARDFDDQYEVVSPDESNRFSFRAVKIGTQYASWPKLVELCEEKPISGLQEMRRGALMAIDRRVLEERMRLYYDPRTEWTALETLETGLTQDGPSFEAKPTRVRSQSMETFCKENLVRYALYPFDNRWSYLSTVPSLWNRPRPALTRQFWPGNKFFLTRMMAERPHERVAMMVTSALPDYHLLRPNAVVIPIRLRCANKLNQNTDQTEMFDQGASPEMSTKANLSTKARQFLRSVGIAHTDVEHCAADLVWMHALAIGYSPSYLSENADGIRQDWPRVPLPDSRQVLLDSSEFGQKVADLLDTERPLSYITMGDIRPEIQAVGVISRDGGGSLQEPELALSAGWGHAGKDGVVMPGKGRLKKRDYTPEERESLRVGAERLGLPLAETLAQLGDSTFDVYLNEVAYWRNIPEKVWEYTIGGYQVIKKWLSYREHALLGRTLTKDEVREVQNIARRIAAIVLLQPALDANYYRCKENVYPWPKART